MKNRVSVHAAGLCGNGKPDRAISHSRTTVEIRKRARSGEIKNQSIVTH